MSKEQIVFVDNNGLPTGELGEKLASHHADTKLHSAFSVYVFNEKGEFLVTKRASTKKVWPNVWSNTCCGHPLPDEDRVDAVKRRLQYELGMTAKDFRVVVADYIYKTPPYNGIVEHEFCPVFIATANSEPVPNPDEVSDYKWVSWQSFVEQTDTDGSDYSDPTGTDAPIWSWWCKDQLKIIKDSPVVAKITQRL